MKYSEFKTEVEKMGLDVDANERIVFARTKSGSIMMAIYKSMENYVDCGWSPYIDTMTDAQRGELFDLAYQLAKTPIVEREEEKKYHLKLELPIPLEDSPMRWLNQKVGASKYHFGSQENIRDYKTIFTESEVAQMDLTGLKLIEVKDE